MSAANDLGIHEDFSDYNFCTFKELHYILSTQLLPIGHGLFYPEYKRSFLSNSYGEWCSRWYELNGIILKVELQFFVGVEGKTN